MTSKPNNDNDSTVTGRNARFTFTGLLLLSFGLLFNLFQPVFAAPEKGGHKTGAYTYVATAIKDYSVIPTGVDEFKVVVSPTPPVGTQIFITFTVGGSASPTSIGSVTDATGTAYFYLTNTTAGTVTVTVEDAADDVETSIDMHFITAPFPPDPSTSYFTIVQNPAAANGTSQDIVEAFIFDKYGNPVNGATVAWAETGAATFVGNPNTTTAFPSGAAVGTSSIGLVSTTVGNVQVTAQVTMGAVTFALADQSSPPQPYLNVQFIQPQPNPTTSYLIALVTPQPADGTSKDEVEAVVYDQTGAPYNGPIAFTFTPPGSATMVSTTNVINGVATAFFTSTIPGNVQVQGQVSVNGTPTYLTDQANPANNYVTIVFANPPPDISTSYITPVITPVAADGASTDEVKAYLVSSSGVPLQQGTVVTFTVISGTATIVQTTVVDNTGTATASLTSTVVGPVEVQATYVDPITHITYTLNDQSNPSQPYSIVNFITGPVDPTKSYLVVSQDNATADGSSQDIVTAYLYDAEGHPITGATVNWSTLSGTATLSAQTGSGNIYVATYVSTVVGPVQVQAQVGGIFINDQNNPTNNYVTIHFVAGQPVTGDPGGPADGGDPGGGNPVNGGNPPTNGGGGSGPGGGSSPGGGNNTGPTSNNGFTVLYIEPQYNYRLSDGQSQDSVFCLVTDAEKHPVANVAVTFFIQTSPTGGTITSGAQWTTTPINVLTGPDGIARMALTSTTPGTVFVDATIVDPATNAVELVAGSYEVAVFVTKPDVTNIQTALTVIIGEALADGSQQNEVKAHVVDVDGNVMPDQLVYFAIDSGTGTIVTPQPVMTDANGDAYIQITSKTVGYVTITAVVDNEKIVFGSPARVYFAAINIYVPRAFSPNNDGVNDLLKPILVGIQTFHYFNVYNRWGNLVFATQDPSQGWDGTFKGVAQPVETYLWIAEGIDENGKKVVAKGMTSLVR